MKSLFSETGVEFVMGISYCVLCGHRSPPLPSIPRQSVGRLLKASLTIGGGTEVGVGLNGYDACCVLIYNLKLDLFLSHAHALHQPNHQHQREHGVAAVTDKG